MGCGASSTKTGTRNEDISKPKNSTTGFNASRLIVDNKGKIQEFYDIEKKKLGEGSYGSVSKGRNKKTGATRAIKSIGKAQMKGDLDKLKMEIEVMKLLDHPNICKLHESFEDHRNVYLVMELCIGGELFDKIIDLGHFSEVQAALVMQQMFRSMYYLHFQNITHRDLKPENFILATKDPIEKSTLKLIDFGLAKKFKKGQVLSTKAGTPYYVAPQVLTGKYDELADLWSLGVIMFVMLCGYPPFHGDNDQEVLDKVRHGRFHFAPSDWKDVSEDAKELIKKLLAFNPLDRHSAEQALNHVWVKNQAPKAKDVKLQQNFVDKLRGFRSGNKLKKAALHVIASSMDDKQIKALRETFQALDDNGDGLLTAAELKQGLEKSGLAEVPPDLQEIMEGLDADGSGVIDYTEFLAATLDKKTYMEEAALWNAFRIFDRDGNGSISKEELHHVLSDGDLKSKFAKDIDALMNDVDGNGDGEIDFEEFVQMMRKEDGKTNTNTNTNTNNNNDNEN